MSLYIANENEIQVQKDQFESRCGKIFSAQKLNWGQLNVFKGSVIYYRKVEDNNIKKVITRVRCGQQIVQLFEDLEAGKIKTQNGIMICSHALPKRNNYIYLHGDDICVSSVKPVEGWIKAADC